MYLSDEVENFLDFEVYDSNFFLPISVNQKRTNRAQKRFILKNEVEMSKGFRQGLKRIGRQFEEETKEA